MDFTCGPHWIGTRLVCAVSAFDCVAAAGIGGAPGEAAGASGSENSRNRGTEGGPGAVLEVEGSDEVAAAAAQAAVAVEVEGVRVREGMMIRLVSLCLAWLAAFAGS